MLLMAAALSLLTGLGACAPRCHLSAISLGSGDLSPAGWRDELQARAAVAFTNVVLFKPADGGPEDLAARFAPLILQELRGGPGGFFDEGDWLADLRDGGIVAGATNGAVVFVASDAVTLQGASHVRLTYLWSYAAGSAPALPVQGLRITLGAGGEPAVYEVLAEPQPARLVFVSRSLENACRTASGDPLPGRRFSAESAVSGVGEAVVARVIEDGPIPLGPIIYLRARTRAVATVTCRCMPSQARAVMANRTYRLARVAALAEIPGVSGLWHRLGERAAFPLAEAGSGTPALGDRLRLPAGF